MGIRHVQIALRDPNTVFSFYFVALAPLGYTNLFNFSDRMGMGTTQNSGSKVAVDLWIRGLKDGEEHIKSLPFAFAAENRKQVDDVYLAALKAGGKDNGPPGFKADYGPGHYTASIIDPEGNIFDIMAD